MSNAPISLGNEADVSFAQLKVLVHIIGLAALVAVDA